MQSVQLFSVGNSCLIIYIADLRNAFMRTPSYSYSPGSHGTPSSVRTKGLAQIQVSQGNLN